MNWYKHNMDISKVKINGSNGILGSDKFIDDVKKIITSLPHGKTASIEQPEYKHLIKYEPDKIFSIIYFLFGSSKEEILSRKRYNFLRLLTIYAMKQYTDMTLQDVGKLFDVKYNSVNSLIRIFNKVLIIKLNYSI